jgi:hypothetical protein
MDIVNNNTQIYIENPIYTEQDYKRRLKSLTQRILLIDANLIYCNGYGYNNCIFEEISGIDFKILGATNKVYNVQVWREYDHLNCMCSCLDYTMRNRNCKHIYWIGSKKFGNMDPANWLIRDYKTLLTEYWVEEENTKIYQGRNTDCPICLEDIDYYTDMIICCKYQCQNAVHANCWSRYYYISGKTNCVVCRADTMPIIADEI